MGIGQVLPPPGGSVSEPSDKVALSLPTALTPRSFTGSQIQAVGVPEDRGQLLVYANGVDPVRLVANDVAYPVGLVAPDTAPTVAAGARATATLDLDVSSDGAYNPANLDTINLVAFVLEFKTALSAADVTKHQIQIGSDAEETINNIVFFVQGTGTEGVHYVTATTAGLPGASVEVTASDATTIDFRSIEFGEGANGYLAATDVGTWGDTSFGTGGKFTGGTSSSGTAPPAGSYSYAYAHYNEVTGAISGISPVASIGISAPSNITLTGLIHSTFDTDTTHVIVYRTTKGGGLFYEVGMVKRGTTTFTDDKSDATITGFNAITHDERVFRTYRAGYPPKTKWLQYDDGSIWSAGHERVAPYDRGTMAFTADDATITLTGGYLIESMVGSSIRRTDAADTGTVYRIMSVDESANTAEMDTTYEGVTGGAAAYEIIDDFDPFESFRSEPAMVNAWPVTDSDKGITDLDPIGVTGIHISGSERLHFCWNSVWSITGSGPYRIDRLLDEGGCVNGNTIVEVSGRIFWMAPDGIRVWDKQSPASILLSSPGNGLGIQGTIDRINFQRHRWFDGEYNQFTQEISWSVVLDDAARPSHMIVYSVKQKQFRVDPIQGITRMGKSVTRSCACASFLADIQGNLIQGHCGDDGDLGVYWVAMCANQDDFTVPEFWEGSGDLSDTTGHTTHSFSPSGLVGNKGRQHAFWVILPFTGDGVYDIEPVVAVSSSTNQVVTVSGTPFTANTLHGRSAVLFDSENATFYKERIASNTTSAVTFERVLEETPTSSWFMILGGSLMQARSGRFNMGVVDEDKIVQLLDIGHVPNSPHLLQFGLTVLSRSKVRLRV